MVEGRDLLRDSEGVAQWQNVHGGTDLDPLCAGGYGGRDDERGGEHRPGGTEVRLGHPDCIEAESFDGVDVREGLLEGVGLAEPLPGVELHE